MDLALFKQQMQALAQIVTGLAALDKGSDCLIGAYQGQLLSEIASAERSGCRRGDLLEAARSAVQLLVELAERDGLTFSREMDALVAEYEPTGRPITRLIRLPRSKPLAAFPKELPVLHTLFVDEAGTASFTEEAQPVLCLVGVLVEDRRIDEFESATSALLQRHDVPITAEIHAQPILGGERFFDALDVDAREALLTEFIKIGMKHVVGVHYLSMLKPLIKEEFREALERRGLNAYTTNVLYFNLMLKAAAIARIGFSQYRYLFDRTDNYGRDIRRILRALKEESNRGLQVHAIAGEPIAVDSKDHRFVQLADVLGYYLVRYRQFEVKTFTPRDALRKHEEKYRAAYDLIRPKVMNFVEDGLYQMVDWKALQEWSPPRAGKAAPVAMPPAVAPSPKLPRNALCPCGSGKKYKKCHGK